MRGAQGYFWGIFLIGVGLLMILKYQLKLNITMPKIIIGMLFLSLGLSMILVVPQENTRSNIIFSESNINTDDPEKEYNVVFGNLVIDLASLPEEGAAETVKINTVFANTLVKIDPQVPTLIKVTSAFGSGNTPDGSTIVFGEHSQMTGEGKARLIIDANVVFGKIDIVNK